MYSFIVYYTIHCILYNALEYSYHQYHHKQLKHFISFYHQKYHLDQLKALHCNVISVFPPLSSPTALDWTPLHSSPISPSLTESNDDDDDDGGDDLMSIMTLVVMMLMTMTMMAMMMTMMAMVHLLLSDRVGRGSEV